MDIHERLRKLRLQLNLTTRAFGAAIHMTGGAITNMEKGTRNITDRTIREVCREYHVNPDWLIYGMEPMFQETIHDFDMDEEIRELVAQYRLLNAGDRALVKKMIDALAEKIKT